MAGVLVQLYNHALRSGALRYTAYLEKQTAQGVTGKANVLLGNHRLSSHNKDINHKHSTTGLTDSARSQNFTPFPFNLRRKIVVNFRVFTSTMPVSQKDLIQDRIKLLPSSN